MSKFKKSNLNVLLLALVLLTANLFSYVVGNWGECGYEPGCERSDGSSIGVTQNNYGIKMYIAAGAGHFLESYSKMTAFMNKVEMAGFYGADYDYMRETVYGAIVEMERAVFAYECLDNLAAATPYKTDFIERLKTFDYENFQKEKGLILSIFSDVKNYLTAGNLRGVFSVFQKRSENILYQLYELKEVLEADRFPEISMIWQINQEYSSVLLFGQYSSSVFRAILQTGQ